MSGVLGKDEELLIMALELGWGRGSWGKFDGKMKREWGNEITTATGILVRKSCNVGLVWPIVT